jgi:hypothetical protein
MNDTKAVDDRARSRNRSFLIAIFVMFFGSMLLAGILRFSGWQPEGRKNHGELLEPPGDLREVALVLADGGEYRWPSEERAWRIVAAPPADCGGRCAELARGLDTVWRLFGKDADRVHVLWICGAESCMPPADARPRTLRVVQPDPRLAAALPRAEATPEGMPVYVIDPNGFVILRYPPGFDPAGLRADVAKLLKLI